MATTVAKQPPKIWDHTIKRLITERPQHFVSWLLKGARFKGFKSVELRETKIEADIIVETELDGEEVLLHIEFQSSDDLRMAQRLLEYNVSATRTHNCRVLSSVLYLRKGNEDNLPVSPLEWRLPNGQHVLSFSFLVIKLWEIPAEDILHLGLLGLLPLVPLAQGGNQRHVIEQMTKQLAAAKEHELLALGHVFAGLVLKGKEDQAWLVRRFAMYHDIAEESWVYQEILAKGVEKGLEKGIKQGVEEERQRSFQKEQSFLQKEQSFLQEQRASLITIVQSRFPALTDLAQQQSTTITDSGILQKLIVKISLAQNAQEATDALESVTVVGKGKASKKKKTE